MAKTFEKVDSLPKSKRDRNPYYEDTVNDFLKAKIKFAKVTDLDDKKLQSVYAGIFNVIKNDNLNAKVYIRKEAVYLENLEK